MADEITGSCLCGAVRWAVDPEDGIVDYCHCDACRRSTGGVAVGWLQVRPDRFRLVSGEVAGYARSAVATRFHCRVCGSQTHMTDVENRSVGVTLGTLDDPEAVRPQAHGFDAERPTWLTLVDDLPRFLRSPPYDA